VKLVDYNADKNGFEATFKTSFDPNINLWFSGTFPLIFPAYFRNTTSNGGANDLSDYAKESWVNDRFYTKTQSDATFETLVHAALTYTTLPQVTQMVGNYDTTLKLWLQDNYSPR
jgi:hypothetical protein